MRTLAVQKGFAEALHQHESCVQYLEVAHTFGFFSALRAGGLPILSRPAGMSHFGCLHFGQRTGRVSTRLTQEWPHRLHSQIMLLGIGMFSHHNIFSP